MKPKLTLHARFKLLQRASKGEPIARLCREAGVSRTIFYRWLNRYKETAGFQNLTSPSKKSEMLNDSVSPRKGAILHRPRHQVTTRIRAIEDVLRKKRSVAEVCRELYISKTIFYRWLKRYKKAGSKVILLKSEGDAIAKSPTLLQHDETEKTYFDEHAALAALEDKKPAITRFHNQVKEEFEALILNAVSEYPELSSHKLVKVLPTIGPRPVVGHHGVQNVLRRHDLNTYEKRLTFAKTHKRAPFVFDVSIKSFLSILTYIGKLPFIARNRTLAGLAAFLIPVGLSIVTLGIWNYLLMYAQAPSVAVGIGYIFASIALFLGMFFLLYSFKYYLSVTLVLIFSRHSLSKEGTEIKGGFSGNALVPDVSDVTLERQPFVSIHLPLYNEKRVVNRLLEAVTSMNYDHFEVIVCDDSTDETKDIVGEWKNHPRVKIFHRESREGFKGGALREALKIMDRRTEFVLVFDADFLPYPDSIEQFLKYFKVLTGSLEQKSYTKSNIAALQGYQWHVLNKSENWITRGVRSEYAGSYVIERSSEEIYGGLKQIAGSVYMIRADILKQFGWGNSITEDFELTLKLYAAGYKVAYTPYLQAPSECVSTIKRLVRQRMRWAEGHSHNIKKYFREIFFGASSVQRIGNSSEGNQLNANLSLSEKLEFAYLSPYYLQSFFFLLGTLAWFIAEAVFRVRLPFWTEVWGWSLVLTNMLSLPLMNVVGMFLEEAEEKDYLGIFSFILLTYIVAPFQAYAAVKGFIEHTEGPWFRTPKTGHITDVFKRGRFYRWLSGIFPTRESAPVVTTATIPVRQYNEPGSLNPIPLTLAPLRSPRRRRWVGNAALGILLTFTTLFTGFARFIPEISQVSAAERKVGLIKNAKEQNTSTPQIPGAEIEPDDGEIKGPTIARFGKIPSKSVEYIFHQEPRIRTKYLGKEVEITLTGADGLGQEAHKKSLKENGKYTYQDIFPDMDVSYTAENEKLTEEIILKSYKDISAIEYQLSVTGLAVVLRDQEVHFASDEGGFPLITFTAPFMFEQNNSDQVSTGIEYRLEKQTIGWKLQKVLTPEGKQWLADPNRIFPVVIDPTSVIQGSISTTESQYGQQQRKIVYADTALNGAAWYAVYQDAANIFYEKSLDGITWTDATDIDGTANGNANPSVWWEADRSKMWVVWANNAADNLKFVDIDVDASDPGTAGTICEGPDQNNHNPTTWLVTIAVANDDDVFVSYVDTSTSTINNLYKVTAGGCSFTSILTGSGVDASDRPVFVTTGAVAHLIFQDGTNLKHSFTNDDGGDLWDRADFTITNNTSLNFSVTTDGTDIWVLIDNGTTGVDLWTCTAASTCTTDPTETVNWTNDTDPWTSSFDATEVSISYISGTDELVAMALEGSGTGEQAYFKTSPAGTVSWGDQWAFGYVAGASGLQDLSSPMNSTSASGVASTVESVTNSEYEFSTLPENLWLFLGIVPFIPTALGRLKKSKIILTIPVR